MTVSKREWNPRISLEEGASCSLQWLIRARQKNVIAPLPPTLYTAYALDEAPPIGFMRDLSGLFRYSSKDDPDTDRARDLALRLLSVATKAHFFLARDALVRHEPYLFPIPDISRPSDPQYGLVYRLDGRPIQAIVVASCDIGLVSSLRSAALRFPVVLTKNSYRWFDLKHWASLAEEGNLLERAMKPWIAKKESDIVEKWTNPNDFPFGTILDIPFEIKEYAKPAGIRWADGLKKWYLPKGFDSEPVIEYARWLEEAHRDTPAELEAMFWRTPAPRKRDSQAKS